MTSRQCWILVLLCIMLCSWYCRVSGLSSNKVSTADFRTSKVKFQVSYTDKTAVKGALISINKTESYFTFGCAMNHYILESKRYQDWFSSRFKFTSFTNEMKWYSTEIKQGQENYTIPDAMLKFCKENGVSVRGHNILWDNPKMQPGWVKNLPHEELLYATLNRIQSIVTRYAGQLIHWDVVNENLHFSFFEDKFGVNASADFYSLAYELDPKAIMFMNEYNTIEFGKDVLPNPLRYKQKLEEILSYPEVSGMSAGIGLQGHFSSDKPNITYMRYALDTLGTLGLPIWLTELDVNKGPNQTQYFEEILREAYGHPAVDGIIIFAGPEIAGFNLTLVDKDFNNTQAGNIVDKLINEWKTYHQKISTDGKGLSSEILLSHGEYNVTIEHPVTKSLKVLNLKVTKKCSQEIIYVEIGP